MSSSLIGTPQSSASKPQGWWGFVLASQIYNSRAPYADQSIFVVTMSKSTAKGITATVIVIIYTVSRIFIYKTAVYIVGLIYYPSKLRSGKKSRKNISKKRFF